MLTTLSSILNINNKFIYPKVAEFQRGRQILENNTEEIFGKRPSDYKTRIMVTMPKEAGEDKKLVRELINSGMNIARINMSHDDEKTYSAIIKNLKDEAKELGKEIKISFDISGPKLRIKWIFTYEKDSKVAVGDKIKIVDSINNVTLEGSPKVQIGTTVPNILKSLKVDQRVLLDDGVLEGKVIKVEEHSADIVITRVSGKSLRIKAEKGLNFPDTDLDVEILDEKDKKDLKFALEHGDIICFSFVRSKEDIIKIKKEMINIDENKAKKIPIMAKIENVEAVKHLAEIILTGASENPFSVMIARGDLAVEIGYIRLAELQQEISWICEAASIPVVWATEVFSNLVDNGIPTRAEVTDATEGALSECIMLNKGNYIVDAVKMLVKIFKNVEVHQYKKTPQLRALDIAKLKNLEADDIIQITQ